MPYCHHGVVNQHTRPSPTHHFGNALSHVRTITVNRALFASSFLFAELTSVQSLPSIVKHFLTFPTKTVIPFMMSAIKPYHQFHRPFFFLNSCHQELYSLCKDSANREENEINSFISSPKCSLSYPKIVNNHDFEKFYAWNLSISFAAFILYI